MIRIYYCSSLSPGLALNTSYQQNECDEGEDNDELECEEDVAGQSLSSLLDDFVGSYQGL